jgi:hypothetical protein
MATNSNIFGPRFTWIQKYSFSLGIALLIFGILCAAYVIRPRLRRRKLKGEWSNNFIYFGHLRYWDPEDLERRLLKGEILPALSAQLVNMSKVAWRKHRMVQLSLVVGLAGFLLLVGCVAASG